MKYCVALLAIIEIPPSEVASCFVIGTGQIVKLEPVPIYRQLIGKVLEGVVAREQIPYETKAHVGRAFPESGMWLG